MSDTVLDKIKSKLRLAADAPEDAVLDAITAPADEVTEEAEVEETPDAEVEAEATPVEKPAEVEPVAAAQFEVPEGFALVPNSTVETLQATAKRIDDSDAAAVKTAREADVAKWIGDGKYPPSARDDLLAAHEANPEATRKLAAATPDGLIPVKERGDGRTKTAATSSDNIHGLFSQLSNPKES